MSRTLLALGSLPSEEMAKLENHFEIIRLWKEEKPEQVIHRHKNDIVAVLSTYNAMGVGKSLIEALPNLEIIAQYGVGTDNIDLETAASHQITVTNTPDILTDDTADIAMALVMALARRVVEGDVYVRVGRWNEGPLPLGISLKGKVLGIVGLGRIGQALAQRAMAFGMEIIYCGPNEKKDRPYRYYGGLKEMAADCDFLALTCPGGESTRNLVDISVLEALGPKGFVINVSRGSVVKEDDLLAALSNRAIAGAGLDVYASEPHVPEGLLSMDNVVLLPHIGSATVETRSKMGQLVVNNLLAYFEGEPLLTPVSVVNSQRI